MFKGLVWITKHRYNALTKEVGLRIRDRVRLMKEHSSRRIQEEFPQLGKRYWGKHFWGIGYAAFSFGHVTDEMIQAYLKGHENHPNHRDDDFVIEWLSVITHKLSACSFQSALAESEAFSLQSILWTFSP